MGPEGSLRVHKGLKPGIGSYPKSDESRPHPYTVFVSDYLPLGIPMRFYDHNTNITHVSSPLFGLFLT